MKIGYACLTVGVLGTDYKSCKLDNVTDKKLIELIAHNLKSLENTIDYNIKNNIKLFRISSDIIPFGSSSVNQLHWWDIFSEQLNDIGKKIIENKMRVSMHPGQYTVLNSPNAEVVARAIDDLIYHTRFLDSLGVNSDHKVILHIGGIYNDKPAAMRRFIDNYHQLSESVKNRLVIENDDRLYSVSDVLEISQELNIPVIYDNLHNQLNPSNPSYTDFQAACECRKTWLKKDGNQKIHYSQQNINKRPGSHSDTIAINQFLEFLNNINQNDIDIMLEVKDKNISAVKCINTILIEQNIKVLESEWARYKYQILEYSPKIYLEIRELLKDKEEYPAIEFYNLIEQALLENPHPTNAINAAQHVWGYFKNIASPKEKKSFFKKLSDYQTEVVSLQLVKKELWRLANKYQIVYLLNSYYFDFK